MVDTHCRIVNVRPKLRVVSESEAVIPVSFTHPDIAEIAHATFDKAMNCEATGIAVVISYADGGVGTSYAIGDNGNYHLLRSGAATLGRRIDDTMIEVSG